MHIKFTCKNCGLEKDANIRLKGTQQYCSDKKCQRVRKAAWQKQKMATDTQYRAKEIALLVSWRKQRPLDQYQKAYRQAHSEYVEKNRKRQKIRNAKRRKQAESAPNEKIVKMDAFAKPSIKSGTYLLTPWEMDASQKIVKMDAFVVQLVLLQQDGQHLLAASP